MAFTILDWQIIERIIDKEENFHIDSIDQDRILQLCFNIFPSVRTVAHYFVSDRVEISSLNMLMTTINKSKLRDKIQCTLPFLQDINGNTALDLALSDGGGDMNLANCLMLGIKDYPFMHSGLSLVSGILKAFHADIPCLGDFL